MNFGLDNIGNSCYINSTLQIIAEMTDIIEILRKYKDNDENYIIPIGLINFNIKNKNTFNILNSGDILSHDLYDNLLNLTYEYRRLDHCAWGSCIKICLSKRTKRKRR